MGQLGLKIKIGGLGGVGGWPDRLSPFVPDYGLCKELPLRSTQQRGRWILYYCMVSQEAQNFQLHSRPGTGHLAETIEDLCDLLLVFCRSVLQCGIPAKDTSLTDLIREAA